MRVGSLFSGIGGIDLGLERAGMEIAWQCESDPYARKVLAKHWPDIPCYPDVRTLPDDIERVDLVCGGFPCQPVSHAGARRGTDDERWLWPAFARCVRLVRPRLVLLENVPGLFTLGFGEVAADLAALGYDTEWTCIPAAAVGAPHLRWRIFVVAHAHGEGESEQSVDALEGQGIMVQGPVAHTQRGSTQLRRGPGELASTPGDAQGKGHQWQRGWDAVRDCGQVENAGHWLTEPDVGRVAHGIPARMDRLRCLGNAVVPQVAELVGRMILSEVGP
jgi:DNA (cytosine-5)-methyltransferase 1